MGLVELSLGFPGSKHHGCSCDVTSCIGVWVSAQQEIRDVLLGIRRRSATIPSGYHGHTVNALLPRLTAEVAQLCRAVGFGD